MEAGRVYSSTEPQLHDATLLDYCMQSGTVGQAQPWIEFHTGQEVKLSWRARAERQGTHAYLCILASVAWGDSTNAVPVMGPKGSVCRVAAWC